MRLRFFNARKEAPFVGHATIAAHAVLLALGRRGAAPVRQACGTGVVEVRIRERPDSPGRAPVIEFRQTVPELDNPLPFKTTLRVAEALKLPATSLHEVMPARIARKGSTRLLVPIADARALDLLAPNAETLMSLGQELGADGFFVFAVDQGSAPHELTTESRMFCPALGIPEDPASGNAHVMLAVVPVRDRPVRQARLGIRRAAGPPHAPPLADRGAPGDGRRRSRSGARRRQRGHRQRGTLAG